MEFQEFLYSNRCKYLAGMISILLFSILLWKIVNPDKPPQESFTPKINQTFRPLYRSFTNSISSFHSNFQNSSKRLLRQTGIL
jgi:hypothetical protein